MEIRWLQRRRGEVQTGGLPHSVASPHTIAPVLTGRRRAASGLPFASTLRQRAACLFMALSIVLLFQPPGVASQANPSMDRFEFGVIGDLSYVPATEPHLDRVLAEVGAAPLAFVVHLGDLGSPTFGSCSDELQARRFAQFQASAHPLIFTPGDNEWTDCWEERAGGMDPLERLNHLRALFFPDDNSLGRRQIPLIRQSSIPGYEKFRENARWSQGSVTFATVHYVDEGLGRTAEGDAEFAERNAANLAWIRAGFAEARVANDLGIVFMTQANPFFERPRADNLAFGELLNTMEQQALAFGKPVLFIHGDTHYFRVDMPLSRSVENCRSGPLRSPNCQIVNFTRIEGFGHPSQRWVQVSVDPADPQLFTVRPRIVAANLTD